jgi:hypothetical protein
MREPEDAKSKKKSNSKDAENNDEEEKSNSGEESDDEEDMDGEQKNGKSAPNPYVKFQLVHGKIFPKTSLLKLANEYKDFELAYGEKPKHAIPVYDTEKRRNSHGKAASESKKVIEDNYEMDITDGAFCLFTYACDMFLRHVAKTVDQFVEFDGRVTAKPKDFIRYIRMIFPEADAENIISFVDEKRKAYRASVMSDVLEKEKKEKEQEDVEKDDKNKTTPSKEENKTKFARRNRVKFQFNEGENEDHISEVSSEREELETAFKRASKNRIEKDDSENEEKALTQIPVQ